MSPQVFFRLPHTVSSQPRRWQAARSRFAMKCSGAAPYGSFLRVPYRGR